MHPLRPLWSASVDEEELWAKLDVALGFALTDWPLAHWIASVVVIDAGDKYPDVRESAISLISAMRDFPA